MREKPYNARMAKQIEPFEPACVQNVLVLAKAYAEHKEFSLRTVGRYFHGTNEIFEQIEAGKASLSLKTYDRMITKFRAEWPKGLPFPKLRGLRRAAKNRGGLRQRRRVRPARPAKRPDLHDQQ